MVPGRVAVRPLLLLLLMKMMMMMMMVVVTVGGDSAVRVPPPANVTVSCHNIQTTVSWNYEEQPQTRFRIDVMQTDKKRHTLETTKHQFSLNRYVWDSAESSMDHYYVTVTAIRAGNQSESVNSETFSFNPLKTCHVKCLLDFPPVELVEGDSGSAVSFKNPLHFYKELKQVAKQGGIVFKYSVSTENETFDATCAVDEPNCRRDVSFREGAARYVKLQGRLCSRDCLGVVQFNDTARVFVSRSDDVLTLTLALMIGILAFVAIVVAVAIFKVKGWTMRREQEKTPSSLNFKRKKMQMYDSQQRDEETSPVILVLPDGGDTADGSEDDCSNSCSQSSEGGYRDGGLSEDSSQGSAYGARGTDGSERTEFVSINSEEEDDRDEGYDRPHHLLDMGNGDMVSCYTGR